MKRFLQFVPIMLLVNLNLLAQSGKISGLITDAKTGEALIGVNVIVEGTMYGAATDVDGFYSMLNVPPESFQ